LSGKDAKADWEYILIKGEKSNGFGPEDGGYITMFQDVVIRRMVSGMFNNEKFSISTLKRPIYDP
jgi:hypothetical protein